MEHGEMSEHSENYGMKMGGHKSVKGPGARKTTEMSHQELCDKCNKMTGHTSEDGPMGKTKEY